MNVLIVYATAHGSTAEVALEVGKRLGERGLNATVADVNDVRSINGYDALVLGSAIHSGVMLKEMRQFINAYQDELMTKPLYLWLNCIRVMEQYGEQHVREYYLDHEVLDPLRIRSLAVFAGKLDLDAVDWNERWTLSARYDGGTWPSNFNGDFRDWNKIRAWADQVAVELLSVKAAQ